MMKLLLLTLLLTITNLISFAQSVTVKSVGENVLNSSFVNAIDLDNHGRLIYACDNGLFRYNANESVCLVSANNIKGFIRLKRSFVFLNNENEIYKYTKGTPEPVELKKLNKNKDRIKKIKRLKGTDWGVIAGNKLIVKSMNGNEKVVVFRQGSELTDFFFEDEKVYVVAEYGVYSYNFLTNTKKMIWSGNDQIRSAFWDTAKKTLVLSYDQNVQILQKNENGFQRKEALDIADVIQSYTFGSNYYFVGRNGLYVYENGKTGNFKNDELKQPLQGILVGKHGELIVIEKGFGLHLIQFPAIRIHDKDFERQLNWKQYTLTYSGEVLQLQKDKETQDIYKGELNHLITTPNYLVISNKDGVFMRRKKEFHKICDGEVLDVACSLDWLYCSKNDKLLAYNLRANQFSNQLAIELGVTDGLSHNVFTDLEIINDTLYAVSVVGSVDRIFKGKVLKSERTNEVISGVYHFQDGKYYLTKRGTIIWKSKSGWGNIQTVEPAWDIIKTEEYLLAASQTGIFATGDGINWTLVVPFNRSEPRGRFLEQNGRCYYISVNQYVEFNHKLNLKNGGDKMVIARFQLNGEDLSTLQRNNLKYGKYKLELEVEQVDLYTGFSQLLEYCVVKDGVGSSWIPLNKGRIITSLNEPGYYAVKIRGGVANSKEFVLTTLFVETPIWHSAWFWGLLFIAIVTLILGISYIRIRRVRSLNTRLARMVDERTQEIQRKNEDILTFAGMISHDVKVPLQNISRLTKMVKMESGRSEEIIDVIGKSSGKLYRHVLNLIDLMKISDNAPTAKVKNEELLETVELSLSELINENQVTIKRQVFCEHTIANEAYLQSIFYNLISNGVKYARANVDSYVLVKIEENEDSFILSFEDNGAGMDLSSGFNPFEKYKRFNQSVEGSGIGLYGIKRMVEAMKGEIYLESTLGEGTKIIMLIPKKND